MRYLLATAFTLLLCSPAFAAFEGPSSAKGGFKGPALENSTAHTVAQVKKAADETRCMLEGKILASGPKHEMYLFQDSTGKISVEIDDDLFVGRVVTPENTVRLYGEVDTRLVGDPEVEVDVLEVLK